jgi:putative oxygen-independent coproporphyrinogen III oxidase
VPTDDPSFGIYVHWPFCASKCPYCDFNSHVRARGIDEARFLKAYLAELRSTAGEVPGRHVSSIYFGGGTPSLMRPATVAAILNEIARLWTIPPDAEITLEANPSSVEAGRFRDYHASGVNRVSLGVQSLDDRELAALGRRHSAADAKAAIEIARRTFARFSFDLIYARPNQSLADWRLELSTALELTGHHISLYQLTIEAGTPFAALNASGKLAMPDADAAAALYALTQELTAARGLAAYEISNHAVPGEESRHNLLYWRYGEFAGIGAGAHGRIVVDGRRHATSNERHPERWLARVEAIGCGRIEYAPLSAAEETDEALLMGLRLAEGLDLNRLARLAGLGPGAAAIDDLVAMGMVERSDEGRRIRASRNGRCVLNEVVARLAASVSQAHALVN